MPGVTHRSLQDLSVGDGNILLILLQELLDLAEQVGMKSHDLISRVEAEALLNRGVAFEGVV